MSSWIGATIPLVSARCAPTMILIPLDGSSLITIWFGSGEAMPKPSFGGCLKTIRTSVSVVGRHLPARMKNGTPDQRQFWISSRSAAYDAVDREIAVVLAAHVMGRVAFDDGAEERRLRILDRPRLAARRRLHGGRGNDLHQVVDDHVAERAHRVVEVPTVLDAEVLGHRDLDAGDVVA